MTKIVVFRQPRLEPLKYRDRQVCHRQDNSGYSIHDRIFIPSGETDISIAIIVHCAIFRCRESILFMIKSDRMSKFMNGGPSDTIR